MSRILTKVALPATLIALLAAGPAVADGGHRGHHGDDSAQASGKVPSRVKQRLARTAKAIDRADERIDDGEGAKAVSQLGAAKRALASAQKSGLKQIVAGDADGPATAAALIAAHHDIVSTLVNDFDGQTAPVDAALADVLKLAVDGRDAVINAVKALPPAEQAAYGRALAGAADGLADELASIAEALTDDTLSDPAKAALTEAQTKITASAAAVQALSVSAGSSNGKNCDDDDDDEDDDDHHRSSRSV